MIEYEEMKAEEIKSSPKEIVKRQLTPEVELAIRNVFELTNLIGNQLNEIGLIYKSITQTTVPNLCSKTSQDYILETLVRPHRQRLSLVQQETTAIQRQQDLQFKEKAISLLEANVSLSTCLRLVNMLRQQDEFITNPLSLCDLFLEARSRFIKSRASQLMKNKAVGADDMKIYEEYLRVMREPVFDVATQYQAAFPDITRLAKFIVKQVVWLRDGISDVILRARNTSILAVYWNQLVLCSSGFASFSANLLPIMESLFIERCTRLCQTIAEAALKQVKSKLSGPVPPDFKGFTSHSQLNIPQEILNSFHLSVCLNSLIDIMDQASHFSHFKMKNIMKDICTSFLSRITEMNENESINTTDISEHLQPLILNIIDNEIF